MSQNSEIFSVRIVIADFYLEKPIPGLDCCYSEFRGSQIKKVPIIRIFGSNADGQKTCMHVHGVFPYFYVPYESKDFESLNKAIYQIAFGLDKALNVSLGQGSAAAQHVFKIQMVKGVPFYGYHRAEHHYLKIYMYNPRFVRRAANLLQNGSILGRVFHPHESHVPYILQFMIDYNLYGMSFMHVPLEIVKFRRQDEADVVNFAKAKTTQILSTSLAKKQACSALEVDIGSNFILNRFQIAMKNATASSKHSNPGIEAIWHDEELRRQKLVQSLGDDDEKIKAIPALAVPTTQERPNVMPTESETFYRIGLLSKLEALEQSLSGSGSFLDQTMHNNTLALSESNAMLNSESSSNKRQTFNLKKLLVNSVYPEECTPDEDLVNASCVENHLATNNIFESSKSSGRDSGTTASASPNNTLIDESQFLDDTIVDEELIVGLTQEQHIPLSDSLRVEDMQLLDILQQLEEENENPIDLDSSLAPLSQSHKDFQQTPDMLDKEVIHAAGNQMESDGNESETENEDNSHLLDFSIALDDIDELLLKISLSQQLSSQQNSEQKEDERAKNLSITQLDGADDILLKSPDKLSNYVKLKRTQQTPPNSPRTPKRNVNLKSPERSPRTPKTNAASKYAPLPIFFSNRSSATKNLARVETNAGSAPSRNLNLQTPNSPLPLHKKLAMTKMRRMTITSAHELSTASPIVAVERSAANKNAAVKRRSARMPVDLEKTHITCALTPRRKSERVLKTCKVDEIEKQQSKGKRKETKKGSNKEIKNKGTEQKKSIRQATSLKELGIKKLCVKIARQDLRKLANEFEKEQKFKKIMEKQRLSKNLKQKGNTAINNRKLLPNKTLEPDKQLEIQTESSQQLPCLKMSEESCFHNEETNESQHELQITLETQEHENGEEITEQINDANFENIRQNLSELTKIFQQLNAPKNLKQPLIDKESINVEEQEEIIAASDTESTPYKTNSKSSSKLKRLKRRSFLNRSALKTPKTSETPRLSMSLNSPSVFSEYSSPGLTPRISPEIEEETNFEAEKPNVTKDQGDVYIFEPANSPPTREYAIKACEKLQIYEYDFQRPFYSDPADMTKGKEVGFTVLQIPGNKLSDCAEFQSVLGDNIVGLAKWRRAQFQQIVGNASLQDYKSNERIREFFATKKQVILEPFNKPPTRHEAKIWLKARELLKNQDDNADSTNAKPSIDEDSPIKIRRQKVTMMLNDETAGDDADDMDTTSCSLTLTPLTPTTPAASGFKLSQSSVVSEQTPLTSNNSESKRNALSLSLSLNRRRHSRRTKRLQSIKTSLHEKLKAAADKELTSNCDNESNAASLPSSQHSNYSTDDSSSISSEIVLAELERSSFVKRMRAGEIRAEKKTEMMDVSFGLTGASMDNSYGFKVNLENLQEAKADIECNYLTTIVMEVFVPTRGDLYPNPELDEIRCIFYAIDNNIPQSEDSTSATAAKTAQKACGYILVHDLQGIIQQEGKVHGLDADIEVKIVNNEIEALEALLSLCAKWDADIYAGYEIEMSSWGYIIERAKFLCLNIAPLLSRVPTQKIRDFVDDERDQYTDLDVEMKLCGRILLDVWRLMRSEIALTSYTFENVVYHILHKRCPWHSYRDLTAWFASPCSRWIVLEYYLERVRGILALLDQLDLLGRTSEMAKLIGIQFYEVLSRGSQFRVESMMLRIAKPRNLVPLSPSVQQRAHMRAPEFLPLILEPQSRFYADPVIVLDFQSLYPSMIIAYNYCFSTCLGRVEHLGTSTPFEFGASQLRVSPKMLRKLIDDELVTISPSGVVFVKSSVREGILPRMLTEILDTRQMVKQSMKLHKNNSALQRILHSRQLGLKLMANVTYGYTAANFSGRMPAVEVGDSVVAKGRETLERTIQMVEANEKWGVKVVYGDTDSLFVQVPGRSREQAFKIGEEIAAAATKDNPHPVKLKLEKVYQPCILQTKKRYVGYMYETADQTDPVYEAKGIETVRRDGCPAVAKMLEKVLRILFETADVSQVKQYVSRQFTKLLSGRANLQDLIFAKEFRGINGYKPTACVPALEMTRKWIQTDPRRIPRRGERVPFIITNGPPGVPLIRLIRSPHEVLADEGLKINAIYYITKAIIPALNRCLLLIGADVHEWFANLPRKLLMTPALSAANQIINYGGNNQQQLQQHQQQQQRKTTISQYFSTTNCIIDCGRQTQEGICKICTPDATKCVVTLATKISEIERAFHLTQHICQACCGRVGDLKCGSLDCPVLYVLENKRRDLKQVDYFRKILEDKF